MLKWQYKNKNTLRLNHLDSNQYPDLSMNILQEHPKALIDYFDSHSKQAFGLF